MYRVLVDTRRLVLSNALRNSIYAGKHLDFGVACGYLMMKTDSIWGAPFDSCRCRPVPFYWVRSKCEDLAIQGAQPFASHGQLL